MIAPANPLGEPLGLKEHFDIFWGMFEQKNLQNIFFTASVNTSVNLKSLFTSGHNEPLERLFPKGECGKVIFFVLLFVSVKERFIKRNYRALKLSFIFNL